MLIDCDGEMDALGGDNGYAFGIANDGRLAGRRCQVRRGAPVIDCAPWV